MKRNINSRSNPSEIVEHLIASMDEISKAKSEKSIYEILEELLVDIFRVDGAEILLYDPKKHTLTYPKWREGPEYDLSQPSGLMGKVLIDMQPRHYNYAISEKDFDKSVDMPNDDRIKALMYIPVLEDDDTINAMIRLYRKVSNRNIFLDEDISLAHSITPFLKKVIRVLKGSGENRDISKEAEHIEKEIEKTEVSTAENSDILLNVSSMVHDIRTPANALGGFLELLEEIIEDKRVLEYIRNAKESAEFINKLTTTILNRVKYGDKSFGNIKSEVYTNKYFASIAEIFTANMSNKNIDYHIYIDPSLPMKIKLDELKLKRVLLNLIGNAWKFTPQGKSVTVDIRHTEDRKGLAISVVDTGLGIPVEKQKEIFETFKQIEGVEGEVDGTGLGLAIVQNYVRSMGGELILKSKPDVGSVFKFTIPLEVVDAQPNIPKYCNLNKTIHIVTGKGQTLSMRWLRKYIQEFGLPLSHISTEEDYRGGATHTIIFENKLSDDILKRVEDDGSKVILFEEKFLSLTSNSRYENYPILSKGTYYGEKLFKATFHKPPVKILVADDNKINLMLIDAILQNERCISDSVDSLAEARAMIDRADLSGSPYELVFLDKYFPDGNGDELAKYIKKNWKDTAVISISGDPDTVDNLNDSYDMHIPKPFKKATIQQIVRDRQKD